ncbi:MAG: S8/S53 family peptidase, partial [Actinomycetota bacterium]
PDVLEEFGIGKQQIIKVPRTGNFQADYKKVESRFAKIEKGKPYWFQGTNIIGISFLNEGPRLRPDGTESTHGIGTAAAVLTANPEAIVVVVEDISEASEEWAFTHPAVDIITTSYGPVTSVPTLNHLSNSYTGVVENGKVHFGAAANDPTYSTFDQTSGPWWSIGVAGFEEGDSGGRQLLSGNVPDFIGDFTQDLPYCRSCEEGTRPVSGTSFATPRSAGTFSAALLEARRRLGHSGGIVKTEEGPSLIGGPEPITNWEMRRALEIAAPYPTFADYGQTPDPTAVPMIDAAPWTQAGWGLITPERRYDVVAETLAHLGLGSKPKTSKPQQACDFMTANMEVRHLYWDNVAVFGQGFGKSKDPYIYC